MKMSLSTTLPLREKKKQQVRERIVEAAMALVHEQGLDNISADDIALRAQVGRATFFRYFESREAAVIVGFYEKRLTALVEALGLAPPELEPMDALIWTFHKLEANHPKIAKMVLLQGTAMNAYPSLRAKAVEFQAGFETAIANAIANRFESPLKNDPRPRMLAAAALALIRTATELWVEVGGRADLLGLVADGLDRLKHGFGLAQPLVITTKRGGRVSTGLHVSRDSSAKRR